MNFFKCLVDNMFKIFDAYSNTYIDHLRQTGHFLIKKIEDSDSFKVLHLLKFSGLFQN